MRGRLLQDHILSNVLDNRQTERRKESQSEKERQRQGQGQSETETCRLLKQITTKTKTTEINNETIWIELKRSLKVAIFHLFGDTFTHRPHTPDSQMHTNEAIFETRK